VEKNDIICAAATPPGRSALAVIRVSGPGSIELVAKSVPALQKTDIMDDRRLIHDYFVNSDGIAFDEVTLTPYFTAKSYTAEEMVEIICHGGYASTNVIIQHLIKSGARMAEPGEFTRRAFLNGRISLSQAEAVAAAIEAKSELALKAAAKNLKGELFDEIDGIKTRIRELLTLIEAEIDFSDEEIDKTPIDRVKSTLENQLAASDEILKSYSFGRGLCEGYKVAIVGRANVGKSSLLNAFLKRQRAIVTEIPGTTRDTLTEWIEIDGFPVLLTDTAGLRKSENMVERIGQDRTRQEIENADLVLFMIDAADGYTDEDKAIFEAIHNEHIIALANKIDLVERIELDRYFHNLQVLKISALYGTGLGDLKRSMVQTFHFDHFSLDMAVLSTQRQYEAMNSACESLSRTLEEIRSGQPPEVYALFIREALDHLGDLTGETTSEDILNDIFGRFCIGK
ncbi:MAG: tRNA uridine-5-carboxymethylaminomethyl(34) synthesis GTPase MnmE, partial [Candidatus Zixiibacteriota bacterium]